jgi:hypothetical protein
VKNLSHVDQSNIKNLKTIFKKLCNHLLREELIGSRKDIELLVLSTGKIYASVLKGDHGRYAICISIGMLRAIWNILLLSLCDNSIFPNYGGEYGKYKVKRRLNPKLVFGPAIIPAKNSQQFVKSKKELQKYQDITSSRKELCEMLYSAILDYLLYHEAMHITRDHFTFKNIYNKMAYVSKAETLRKNTRFFQFLEIDADLTALNFLLPTNPEITQFDGLPKFRKGDFVFGQMFSNIILHQLFDFEQRAYSLENQWKGDHPPPLVRSMLYDNLLYQFFIQKKLLPKEEVRDQQSKAWWEASRIAIKLGFPKGRWHGKTVDGVPFKKFRKLIDGFNSFQLAIERANSFGSYNEIKKVINKL